MSPKKRATYKPKRSLAKEVDEAWHYFWRKRGMMPPKNGIVLQGNLGDDSKIKAKQEEDWQ